MTEANKVSVKEMMNFFGYKDETTGKPQTGKFTADWKNLTETDKEQIRSGFNNGSMTY